MLNYSNSKPQNFFEALGRVVDNEARSLDGVRAGGVLDNIRDNIRDSAAKRLGLGAGFGFRLAV